MAKVYTSLFLIGLSFIVFYGLFRVVHMYMEKKKREIEQDIVKRNRKF
jgi:predicted DNA repair protein MutK